ncbi:MAG: tRNA (adenosine(37)-N6)-threonylcarbamoyltransferase complex dimerization subunit type 1 TsaB [Chitinophagales bacterium]|nr:tRNA (adenosine(37)-N6)-threonylcarbamoyltransferase complex dimerization subunit type 1 TsaB [Chitinophagales bacterium]
MAYILHIDTSGDTGLVALAKDGSSIGVIENTDTRNHAATLNTNIEQLLQQNSIGLNDLHAIAVCGGPGSYTGLRIGLATAKGFCYALDKPLMMHNKLLLMATRHAYSNEEVANIVSILQARDKEYFIAVYNKSLQVLIEPRHIFEEQLANIAAEIPGSGLVTGYINDVIRSVFNVQPEHENGTEKIDIDSWVRYTSEQYNCHGFITLASAEPFYLKQVYTHKPKTTK